MFLLTHAFWTYVIAAIMFLSIPLTIKNIGVEKDPTTPGVAAIVIVVQVVMLAGLLFGIK